MQAIKKIVAVNFSYAMQDGMWTETEKGSKNWDSFTTLVKELGQDEVSRLYKIAFANGMTGMWYNATTGQNCFVNGERVG